MVPRSRCEEDSVLVGMEVCENGIKRGVYVNVRRRYPSKDVSTWWTDHVVKACFVGVARQARMGN